MLARLITHHTTENRFRKGTAALELGLTLPILLLLFIIAIDFARTIYPLVTITTCARNGAIYLSDPLAIPQSPYANYQAAALADGSNLQNPTLQTSNVTSASGSSGSGNPYAQVTVQYAVPMGHSYLGFSSFQLTRTVRMPVLQSVPNF